jgi:anti-sigma regulatory factor (Ser/Thr protein kinase)
MNGPTTRERRFPRQRRSVRDAREFVIGTLTAWGYDEVPDSLRLCVSEVVTNALLHGVPPGRLFAVRITADGAMIRVEVRDSGDGVPELRDPGLCEETGRGLRLVAALADDWGVVRHAVGKTVWVSVTA